MTIAIIIGTLGAVGVGYVTFLAGRWFERRRLAGLIEWACVLAQDIDASMNALEAAGLHVDISSEEPGEVRMH